MSNTYALILAVAVVGWTLVAAHLDKVLWLCVLPHNAAWVAGCAVVGSGLMNYYPLSPQAWSLITGSIIAVNLGVLTARVPRIRAVRAAAARSPGTGDDVPAAGRGALLELVSMRAYVVLLVGFVVGFGIYLRTIASLYGLGTLITDPSSIREWGSSGGTYLQMFPLYGKVLFYLGPLCFVLTVCPDLVRGLREKSKVLRISLAIFLIVAQVATLQRTNLFISILWAAGIILLQLGASTRGTRIRRPRLGVVVVLGLVSLLAFQGIAVALGKTGSESRALADSVSPVMRNSPFLAVMHYAGGGIPAFGNLVNSHDFRWPEVTGLGIWGDYNPQTWGAATFFALFKMVPGAKEWPQISPFTRLPAPTNVYTWLEPWYRDFRAPGVILGAIIIGWLIGFAANRIGESPRALVLGGLLLGLSGMAIFINQYTSVLTLVLYVVVCFVGRKPKRADAAGSPSASLPASPSASPSAQHVQFGPSG